MSHSVCIFYVHIIFSTKNRSPWIKDDLRNDLYSYMGGIIKHLNGEPLAINGSFDHIHVLCTLPKDMDISTLMRNIKANSSKWLHQKYSPHYFWQDGYGAFSVGLSNLERVISYIQNQEEHHKNKSFLEEYHSMLRSFGIVPYGESE